MIYSYLITVSSFLIIFLLISLIKAYSKINKLKTFEVSIENEEKTKNIKCLSDYVSISLYDGLYNLNLSKDNYVKITPDQFKTLTLRIFNRWDMINKK